MNTSQFMDKQIMDLTSSPNNNNDKDKDFIDLMNHPQQEEEDHDINNGIGIGIKKEEIVPSYDFRPIRGGLSQALNLDSTTTANTSRVWNSAENKNNSSSSPIRNYGSLDSIEPSKFIVGKDQNGSDAAMVSEIDRTIKKYADNLLHVLEGVSARLIQLETRTHNLESSIDDLKVSVGNNHGSTDGKMRHMENILREVQLGVVVLKDKQEILEAQLLLGKLQVSKVDQPSETPSTGHTDSVQQAASAPLQSHIQPPVNFPQSVPHHPPSIVPPPAAPQHNPPPTVQLSNQFPQSQIPSVPHRETFLPAPGQTQDASNQQYQVPPPQQQQPAPAAPPFQTYQPALQPTFPQPPQPQYSQPTQQPPLQSSLGRLSEETAYIPSQNYPPNHRQPASQPPGASPPSQTYFSPPPPHMYEPPSGRSNSGFPTGYGPQSGPNEPFPYGAVPSQYGSGSTMKPPQHSSAMVQSGGSGYPQLPTARVLPHAIPTASGVSSGTGSPGTGNRVPNEDVIDKVTSMGFPRDHVRATVRKLMENGQSVDLNMVLDKLMNDGEVQPLRGWFGR